ASARLGDAEAADLLALDKAWTAMTGAPPPAVSDTKEENEMAGRVYVPVADIGSFEDAMGKVKPVEGLHPMMGFETYNFADGRRTALEVYRAVAAEALSAGDWYYGTVAPAD